MLGYLEFKDVIDSIFEEQSCVESTSISSFEGKKLGIDFFSTSINCLEKIVKDKDVYGCHLNLKSQLNRNNVDVLFVGPGICSFNQDTFMKFTHKAKHIYCKLLFFKMIYHLHSSIDTEFISSSLAMARESFIKDGAISHLLMTYFIDFMAHLCKNNGIDYILAPQQIENQLLWLLDNNHVDCVATSPVIFIHKGINQVIRKIDLDGNRIEYYDLDMLARKLVIEPEELRHLLLAGLFDFMLLDKDNAEAKVTKSTESRISDFKFAYINCLSESKNRFYDLLDKLKTRPEVRETGISLCRFIAAQLDVDKGSVMNLYNVFMKSPVLTANTELQYYPEMRSMSKVGILDTSKKDIIVLRSMSYISPILFDLINSCTNHTHNLRPMRGESFECDICFVSFYLKWTQKPLYKLLMLMHDDNSEKFRGIAYKIKTTDQEIIELKPKNHNLSLKTISFTSIDAAVDYYDSLKAFFDSLIRNEKAGVLFKDQALTESQILTILRLNLLHELSYIDMDGSKILTLGAGMLKQGKCEFEEDLILFFELVKLGAFKGRPFNSPTSTHFPYNDHMGVATGTTIKEKIQTSHKIGFDFPQALMRKSNQAYLEIENQFYTSYKKYKEIVTFTQANDLYTLESCINKLFEHLQIIRQRFKASHSDLSESQIDSLIEEPVAENFFIMRIMGNMFMLAENNYSNETEFFDFECLQFTECLQNIQRPLHQKLSIDLLYLLHSGLRRQDLGLTDQVFRKLPFSGRRGAQFGSIIKILIAKYLIFKRIKNTPLSFKDELARELKIAHIDSWLQKTGMFQELVKGRLSLIRYIIAIANDKKALSLVYDVLCDVRDLLEEFFEFSTRK